MITRHNLPSTQQLIACLQLSTVTAKCTCRSTIGLHFIVFLNYYVVTVCVLCNTNLFTCICNTHTHSKLDVVQGKCENVPPPSDVSEH